MNMVIRTAFKRKLMASRKKQLTNRNRLGTYDDEEHELFKGDPIYYKTQDSLSLLVRRQSWGPSAI